MLDERSHNNCFIIRTKLITILLLFNIHYFLFTIKYSDWSVHFQRIIQNITSEFNLTLRKNHLNYSKYVYSSIVSKVYLVNRKLILSYPATNLLSSVPNQYNDKFNWSAII